MPRSFAVVLWLTLAAPLPGVWSAAFAQASPVSEGPMGTPRPRGMRGRRVSGGSAACIWMTTAIGSPIARRAR
jgi:hypothetical protein